MPAIHHSHPEAEERAIAPERSIRPSAAAPRALAPKAEIKPRTPEVYEELRAFLATRPEMNQARIAKATGFNPAYVSRYFHDEFIGDLPRFEAALVDLMRGERLREDWTIPQIETSISRQVANFADHVRGCGSIGVLHGDAGLGKSVGLSMYAALNKACILITASTGANDAKGLRQLLWPHLAAGYRAGTPRWTHILSALRGSNRLVIVDNAQRLNAEGRHTICDLIDETRCPVLLAGNPEIIARIRAYDQQYSRSLPTYAPILNDAESIAAHILGNLLPDHAEDFLEEAVTVALAKGHLRQLYNRAKATASYLAAGRYHGDARKAWNAARDMSIAA